MKNDERNNNEKSKSKKFKQKIVIAIIVVVILFVTIPTIITGYYMIAFFNFKMDNSPTSIMDRIESGSGIDFPDSSNLIHFHQVPPIDPIVIAKISIPSESYEDIKNNISLKPDGNFTGEGALLSDAEEVVNWWQPNNIIVSRQYYHERNFIVTVILTEENGEYFVYIECAVV